MTPVSELGRLEAARVAHAGMAAGTAAALRSCYSASEQLCSVWQLRWIRVSSESATSFRMQTIAGASCPFCMQTPAGASCSECINCSHLPFRMQFKTTCRCRVVPPRLFQELGGGRAAREVQVGHCGSRCATLMYNGSLHGRPASRVGQRTCPLRSLSLLSCVWRPAAALHLQGGQGGR